MAIDTDGATPGIVAHNNTYLQLQGGRSAREGNASPTCCTGQKPHVGDSCTEAGPRDPFTAPAQIQSMSNAIFLFVTRAAAEQDAVNCVQTGAGQRQGSERLDAAQQQTDSPDDVFLSL